MKKKILRMSAIAVLLRRTLRKLLKRLMNKLLNQMFWTKGNFLHHKILFISQWDGMHKITPN
jgi:hypothetical protein